MKRAITILVSLALSSFAYSQVAVDLGLSVKWANCNVGASAPEQYGDYYAWGETSTKTIYSWKTYRFYDKSLDTQMKYNVTKYCRQKGYGTVDKLKDLEPQDDVARVKMKGKWRMPAQEEWEELMKQCKWTWTTQKGVKGYLVTSIKNGNSIFLPAAGHKIQDETSGAGALGFYWSNTMGLSYGAYGWTLFFGSANKLSGSYSRSDGQSVRAVCD